MNLFNRQLYLPFYSKKIIKVIIGLDNSNIHQILKIAKAAELSDANYIDIIANPYIVKLLKSIVNLPICVSSINPISLYNCVLSGADLVEIGNFDMFYKDNIYLTYIDIINLAKETRSLVGNIDICVTIPHYLSLNEQIQIAKELESLGINILQTEGISLNNYTDYKLLFDNKLSDKISISTDLSALTLSSTYILSKFVDIPIITSSAMNCLTCPIANFYGSSGVGIGKAISQEKNIYNMSYYINEVRNSIYYTSNFYPDNNFIMNLRINNYKDNFKNLID
uniref:Uncharacterized protein ycf23 n=1 Tax=Sonderella linearis TaxID=110477 RepID=A0A1Z1MLL0_9FLOR|nr:hypothetical protein [Sonderella linearis]ARW66990.1 hypothetical protein [Sonderella linearis]